MAKQVQTRVRKKERKKHYLMELFMLIHLLIILWLRLLMFKATPFHGLHQV